MSDKEATVFIVDVGRSMNEKRHGREQTDLQWALQYVWDKITSTVYTGRKTLYTGVIGLGTNQTENELEDDEGYHHISVLQPISQILMPELRRLEERLRPSTTDSRDAISAVVLAIQMIEKHCRHLKYLRRIILVTNGTGSIDPDNIDDIAEKVKNDGIELVILGVDFDDPEYGFEEKGKSSSKAKHERLLHDLATKSGGVFGTLEEAVNELRFPRIKMVRPTPTYRGELRLGDPNTYETALAIQIERYPKVMRRAVPSASSFVAKSESASQQGDPMAGVRANYVYEIADTSGSSANQNIEREDLAKGYEYGRTAVHISESEENITKFETDASYEILGFIPVDKVERYTFLDNSSVLVAQKGNNKASLALSSLAHGLFELDTCAVARLVKKDMSEPLITLLSASVEPGYECLVENQLPFAEDVRSYRFPPLDKVATVSGKLLKQHRNLPNDQLSNAMSDFIDSMNLANQDEDFSLDESFSPVVHRIEDSIKRRAVNPKEPISVASDVLTRYSKPPTEAVSASHTALERLAEAADVKKVPPKVKGRRRYRETEKPLSGLNVEDLFRKESKRSISSDNAVPEFKRMLDVSEDIDTIRDAMKQMTSIVEDQIRKSYADLAYARALEAITVMRQEMLELEEPVLYNDMLRGLKRKLSAEKLGGNRQEIWFMIGRARVGLIDKRQSSVSDVSTEDAEAFMKSK